MATPITTRSTNALLSTLCRDFADFADFTDLTVPAWRFMGSYKVSYKVLSGAPLRDLWGLRSLGFRVVICGVISPLTLAIIIVTLLYSSTYNYP